jgi:hypothetical protein
MTTAMLAPRVGFRPVLRLPRFPTTALLAVAGVLAAAALLAIVVTRAGVIDRSGHIQLPTGGAMQIVRSVLTDGVWISGGVVVLVVLLAYRLLDRR